MHQDGSGPKMTGRIARDNLGPDLVQECDNLRVTQALLHEKLSNSGQHKRNRKPVDALAHCRICEPDRTVTLQIRKQGILGDVSDISLDGSRD